MRLEAAGFKFGTVRELFDLSAAEELLVEMKVAIAEAVRALREEHALSQADLARLIGSGQGRVSKLERSFEPASLDTLFRCMLVMGASRRDLAEAIARPARPKKSAGRSKSRAKRPAHLAAS
jgi:predicted XRE-type DNA-binding protein